MVDADVNKRKARMAIGAIAHDDTEFRHEQESALRFRQVGVLKEARRQSGFPRGGLSRATDRASLFALTTLWESTGACAAWQAQQLLPAARTYPDLVGLGQPVTAGILEVVQTGRARARATDDHGQVAAKPALTRRAAVQWTAIKPNRSGSRCYS